MSYILLRDARQQLNVAGGIVYTNEHGGTGDDISTALALTARLVQVFSLKVSHAVRVAHPPPDFKEVDTISAVALVSKS